MDVVIRSAAEGDLEVIHAILTSPHVVAGSMRVPYAPLHQTRERLVSARGIYQLVAESEGRVVGFGELITQHACDPALRAPRVRHRGHHAADGLRRRRLDGRLPHGPPPRLTA